MTTWYLDAANGNDANDGSSGSPFKTIQGALDATTLAADGSYFVLRDTGTYNVAASLDFTAHGTPDINKDFFLIGCTSEPGDGGMVTIDCVTVLQSVGLNYQHLENLIVLGDGGPSITFYVNANGSLLNCVFLDSRVTIGGGSTARRCYFKAGSTNQNNVVQMFSSAIIYDCVIEGRDSGNMTQLVVAPGNYGGLFDCLIIAHGSTSFGAVYMNGLWVTATRCTVVGDGTSHAFYSTNGKRQQAITDCVIVGFENAYFGVGTLNGPRALEFCKLWNVTNLYSGAPAASLPLTLQETNEILSADPFVDSANHDYRLSEPPEMYEVNGFPFDKAMGAVGSLHEGGGATGLNPGRIVSGGV